jgi:photosystem II stability/assembly factor-like uncharacterized protein
MKVIINAEINIQTALDRVKQVIDGGLVSVGTYGAQYCFVTTWNDGVRVYADKTKNGTHTFKVWENK